VRKIREVLRLKAAGVSDRKIATALDSFLNTAGAAIAVTGRYLGSYSTEIAKSQSVRASLGIAGGTYPLH
jgi:hypothetical protein